MIGLSSGTSMDGIDAALVQLDHLSVPASIELIAFETYAYKRSLTEALRAAPKKALPADLAVMDVMVGEEFALAALKLLEMAGVEACKIAAIGSHGQTIIHLPGQKTCASQAIHASLQIGQPAVIAERTGIMTVADFRTRDLASGGQGAPLVPLLDHRLYAHRTIGRVALNVGGIANVTGLPPSSDLSGVLAFDTGPGNVLLDAAARHRGIEAGCDVDGKLALSGQPQEDVLDELLANPFFQRKPPKSADTMDFLNDRTTALFGRAESISDADLLSTLTEFTASTVATGIARFLAVRQPVDEVLISGGGAYNHALRGRLSELLSTAQLRDAGEVASVPGDAKEAVAFAILAAETLAGRPGNVPTATGASGPRVLGAIVPGL
ncbi:MAG: anhydro-N-acetylmuramic acid kinase [Acidobacteriota bacterium]|nr:anhydro-N-acetylmuramic acid kinase [Acidobacteriota bacterium]